MAPRTSWKGYLKLSLVSCPVRLYPRRERVGADRRSTMLHKDTHNRINMKPVDPELGLVERSDLVKGYEYEPKQYIVIEDEDLEAVRIESNHTLNIEAFVDEGDIDVTYQDVPYYLAPDGKMADETFIVLREAMKKTGKVAIARLVLSSRERTVAICARGKGMLVSTLRNPAEVRKTTEYFEEIPDQKADPEMLQLAETLITQKVTEFDFAKYEDRYEVALQEMIKQKLKGHKPIIAAAPERGNVINLMDALKASLGQGKPAAPSKSKAKAPAEEAAPAKAKKAAPKAAAQGPRRSGKPDSLQLKGATIGIVGALAAFPRRLAEREVTRHGARLRRGLTRQTKLLVFGRRALVDAHRRGDREAVRRGRDGQGEDGERERLPPDARPRRPTPTATPTCRATRSRCRPTSSRGCSTS